MIRKVYEADPMICICFLGSIFASFVSLTSPSGRKYITNVVKLGDIGRSRNSSRRGKRKYLSFAIQILLSAIEIDMNSAPRKALTDPL